VPALQYGAADGERRGAQLFALRRREEHRRRALHHLLVAALHRAVALEQVHQGTVRIAEYLYLDVARALHQLLQKHLVVAEGGLRLAAAQRQQLLKLRRVSHQPRAAPAPAPARLQHQRIAET
jgi:hypothetical protein